MAETGKIYILDQVTPKAGRGQEFHKLYMETYVPAAKARGMHLEYCWVAPPMWLHNQTNVLYFVWSVDGVAGWWSSQMKARLDETVGDWWAGAQPLIDHRRRDFLANASEMEALSNV